MGKKRAELSYQLPADTDLAALFDRLGIPFARGPLGTVSSREPLTEAQKRALDRALRKLARK